MSYRPQAVLHLELHMLPALRQAFEEAITQLSPQLLNLRNQARIPQPWLGDEVSAGSAAFYHEHIVDGPQSALNALLTYEAELVKVRDNLKQMEDDYRRVEGENAARWGRQA
ncbi:hypothetical protein ACVGVM_04925 [Pseudonocardia bannensis]|uniref:PE family protein n=1 Tax=Pseudonocardia bannensis TaxID=630973 RepID=A0A848DPF8_9PSEU|nr:hypothetical protein [Pseudonocardia bannensis]NMH94628.1 hypothetical protein [Pseudonocardia bannensis]